ncbi:GNAT family N-acetyltransferase [uncultured Tateyamaria sp.]|uniref:GNAT family N-acetyltransferase n=1 Tax=uncultured Tateyamaria sp. TaxID=455651 RepID=UPI00260BDFA5|nr:GNAT family N-acetyltransferase [uncultured Tateyamaria sp.]
MLSDGFHDVPHGKIATIVTDLEMHAPQLRGATRPEGLAFIRLDPDVPTYRDLFKRVGQDWLWFGRTLLSDKALDTILRDPDVHIYALERDGQAEALLELDFRVEGECELTYFGLTSTLIGAGAGAYLMDRAIALAFEGGAKRFHLHTCTLDSPQALGFYRRSGFKPTRQRVEIADDPRIAHEYDRTLGPHIPIFDP